MAPVMVSSSLPAFRAFSSSGWRVCMVWVNSFSNWRTLFYGHLVEQAVGGHIDNGHLVFHALGRELGLLQDFEVAAAALNGEAGRGVEVGAELGEGLQLAELGLIELQRTGHLSSST